MLILYFSLSFILEKKCENRDASLLYIGTVENGKKKVLVQTRVMEQEDRPLIRPSKNRLPDLYWEIVDPNTSFPQVSVQILTTIPLATLAMVFWIDYKNIV